MLAADEPHGAPSPRMGPDRQRNPWPALAGGFLYLPAGRSPGQLPTRTLPPPTAWHREQRERRSVSHRLLELMPDAAQAARRATRSNVGRLTLAHARQSHLMVPAS